MYYLYKRKNFSFRLKLLQKHGSPKTWKLYQKSDVFCKSLKLGHTERKHADDMSSKSSSRQTFARALAQHIKKRFGKTLISMMKKTVGLIEVIKMWLMRTTELLERAKEKEKNCKICLLINEYLMYWKIKISPTSCQ